MQYLATGHAEVILPGKYHPEIQATFKIIIVSIKAV